MTVAKTFFSSAVTCVLVFSMAGCNSFSAQKSQAKQKNDDSTAPAIGSTLMEDPETGRKEVIVHMKPLAENMNLECDSWDIPMIERFPSHILLNGAKSEKIYLRRDWAIWYFIPVFPGSLKTKEPSCEVNTSPTNGQKQIQCKYFSGLLRSERLLTVPLVASKVAVSYHDDKPMYEKWFVLKAKLSGRKVYKNSDEVELTCYPRSPEFGYEPLTEKDVKKVQPWDRTE